MLRRFLDYQRKLSEKGGPLYRLAPLIEAGDTFLYEAEIQTKSAPHIRDAIDLKRWMLIVVFALMPCFLMGIWNTGLQNFVYTSGNFRLMEEYLGSLNSLASYFQFALKEDRWMTILWLGLKTVMPLLFLTYFFGGMTEALFACVRRHPISEGFLVTGILYTLILPPTIPYWMAAVGIIAGVVLAKEVFGGSGMNILNPALSARAFLFFTFPGRMSGNVWVGTNPTLTRESLVKMNQEAPLAAMDGYTQATPLAQFNVPAEVKRIHVDAIAANTIGSDVMSYPLIEKKLAAFDHIHKSQSILGEMNLDQLKAFVTSSATDGGLGLSPGYFENAGSFASLHYGLGPLYSNEGLFFGNKLGSIGETSTFACILGALFLVFTGVGSYRTMIGMALGAFLTAFSFEYIAKFFTLDGGAFVAAAFTFPAYKQLLLGGLAFGLVFMATDPVSSPVQPLAKWIYGAFAGFITIVIRTMNPAYPEAVMLAILMANVFAPLIDSYVLRFARYRLKKLRASRG